MSFKTIIIEDEEKSLHVLQELISELVHDLTVCGTASHIESAIRLIETSAPDLVFMDVCIGDGTGFDVLMNVTNRNFELIFITAYDNYALQAFRFSAIDYLLKPIGMDEFEEAVEKARKRLSAGKSYDRIEGLLNNVFQ